MDADGLTAGDLISMGYYQISARYHTLARLPPGLSGVEALMAATKANGRAPLELERWAYGLGEGHCGDLFLRLYANGKIHVTHEVFKEYRRLGGGTYDAKHWATGFVSKVVGCPIDASLLHVIDSHTFRCDMRGHIIEVRDGDRREEGVRDRHEP